MIIWWLPAVSPDIQSESSVDHVFITCRYTVIRWWLPACSCWYSVRIISWPCVDYSDYLMIICYSCWNSVRFVSWPCINNILIYSDYLMITCCYCWYLVKIVGLPCIHNMLVYSDYLMIIINWPCVDSMLIKSWPCVDIQWLSDNYLLFLLIFRQDHNLTMCWYTVIIWWLYAVPADIQSESSELSVDHVSIICWYTVIIWWLPAVPPDI